MERTKTYLGDIEFRELQKSLLIEQLDINILNLRSCITDS